VAEGFLSNAWNALLGRKTRDLDSFGEIYTGFNRDRELFKSRAVNPDTLWREAFREFRRDDTFFQRDDDVVARETMRMLLTLLPPV
jgi:hypothetical protein